MTSSREWRNRLILLSATVLLMLFTMEIGCRLLRGTWFLTHWPNLVLLEAEDSRTDLSPITDEWPDLDLATAYAVQDETLRRRLARGRALS